MNKAESKLDHDLSKNKEEFKQLPANNTISQEKNFLTNELLSSLIKKTPHFEKKYENEELNKFKDDILTYLSERNQHYLTLIKFFQNKIEDSKNEYVSQINNISQNYNSILSSQASLNNKIDKFSSFENFINKTNDQLITHEIRINNLSSDFIKSTQKYDKIYLENLELPGYIGKFAKFKNCQAFFDNIIREIDKINLYKEKNNLDLKSYKEKLDNILKNFHLLVRNNNESQMKYIKQLNDKCLKECKDMNDLLNNRVCDLRIENAKYSIELVKKNEEMNNEWKKIVEMKDSILNTVDEKITNFKNIFNANVISFNNFKKEFEDFRNELNDVIFYYKEIKSENSNGINSNLNNNNSSKNLNGYYVNNAPTLDKKNIKNIPRKFSKRSKTKNRYLDKKQFIKNISNLNTNKNNHNNIFNEYKSNIIKIEKLEEINNNTGMNKERENKKRNSVNSVNKEKTLNSNDKYKFYSDYQPRRSGYSYKEPRSSKIVTKIEIDSQNKVNTNFENNKKNDNKNIIQIKINEDKSTNTINNDNIKNNLNENKEKEEIVIHKYSKKNKKAFLQSSKSIKSDDSENNNISNINNGNSNTLNTTNDINYSVYSTNSICNVNRFILNDNILDANDKVIKELASELEQSTNKKDKINSNAKKIEDNFKAICSKIPPLNLNINKNNDKNNNLKENISIKTIINENENENENENDENANNNLNIAENIRVNTISTEKTEERKITPNNNNNICSININRNDYNLLNKKIDTFEKKLTDLENLLKGKIMEILLQIDMLQKNNNYTLNNKKPVKQKIYMNTNINSNNSNNNRNLTGPNELFNNNIKNKNSRDDYFVHSHSVKRIAPIIEIDPVNLQFSPSPTRNENIMSNRKSKEQKSKDNKMRFINNFNEIKIIKKNENKENIRTNNNNDKIDKSDKFDKFDLTQFRIFGKNGNGLGVNKWFNLNKLIKYEQSRTSNFSSNNGGLLVNGNFDNN